MPGGASVREPRPRRPRVPLSQQPYRMSMKAPFVTYTTVVVVVIAAPVMSVTQGRFSWAWIFPFAASAATVYLYRHERAAKNMRDGTLLAFAGIICALGTYALIALPAKF